LPCLFIQLRKVVFIIDIVIINQYSTSLIEFYLCDHAGAYVTDLQYIFTLYDIYTAYDMCLLGGVLCGEAGHPHGPGEPQRRCHRYGPPAGLHRGAPGGHPAQRAPSQGEEVSRGGLSVTSVLHTLLELLSQKCHFKSGTKRAQERYLRCEVIVIFFLFFSLLPFYKYYILL